MTRLNKIIEQIEAKHKEITLWSRERDKQAKKYRREMLRLCEQYIKLTDKDKTK